MEAIMKMNGFDKKEREKNQYKIGKRDLATIHKRAGGSALRRDESNVKPVGNYHNLHSLSSDLSEG